MPSERIQRQIDSLLDEAEAAIRGDDWETVRQRAGAALALDPENADALTLIAAAERARPVPAGEQTPSRPAAESLRSLPESFASGRYRVKSFLGEGGRKRVYLAHDTRLDRDVAFSLIKTEGLDAAALMRVRNEAQAMARLGDYPNVVTVFDVGEEPARAPGEAAQPFLVCQYMGGGSLEAVLGGDGPGAGNALQVSEHRLAIADAVRITAEVCQGLEQTHRRGIVHRDLKPGNIWLTEDGAACVGDFGLAVALDRSRLTAEGSFVGTALYMAPEQALGQTPDPRSDLYSLGCVLYEVVTGRPPFLGDDTVAVVTQHLNTPPVAPTWHRPDCPPGLEALVLRLLEKDPAKRPQSAGEVSQALASIDLNTASALRQAQGGQTSALSVHPEPVEGPTPHAGADPIYRQTFVGRETELTQLRTAFDNALSGQGALVMVVGEPGIGKTALTEQLSTYVAMRGGRALHGNCYEEGSLSLPYLPFIEAMRSYVLARDPEDLKSDLGANAGYVARIVSEVRDRIEVEVPAAGDPEDDRWRLFQAVTAFLRQAATIQPLVLVLEDLHWSDKGSLDFLQHLARNLARARLLLIGTYRDVEVDRTHPLSGALAELRRIGSFATVRLRGLSAEDVLKMLSQIAGREVQRTTADQVHRQTEGNPLFVQEVMRYLVEEGILARDEHGQLQRQGDTPITMQIPEGLRDVIGKRISRLSAECSRLLTMAAVIGRDFTLATLTKVAGGEEEALLAALDEAVRIGILEERSQVGGVQYRFAHAFFRQTLYEELGAARRLRLHQQVGRALEEVYRTRVSEHAAELAEHFSHSTDTADLAKAVAYGETAAQRAMSVFDYGEACRLLERALDVQEVLDPDDKAKRCDLLLAYGDALMPAGEPLRAAEEVAEEAFLLAEAMGDRERACRACSIGRAGIFRYGGIAMFATPASHKWADRYDVQAGPGTVHRVYADLALAQLLFSEDEWGKGWPVIDKALGLARQIDDPEALFSVAQMIVGPPHTPERQETRLRVAEEFGGRRRDGVSVRTLAGVLNGVQVTLLDWGFRPQAEEVTRQLRELAERTRDPHAVIISGFCKTRLDIIDGRLEEAVAAARERGDAAADLGAAVFAVYQSTILAFRPLLNLGRAEEALRGVGQYEASAGVGERAHVAAQRAVCLAHLRRFGEAQAEVRRLLAWDAQGGVDRRKLHFAATVLLLEAAVLGAEREAAAQLSQRLANLSNLATGHTICICLARLLGGAALLLGKPAQARAYYLQALEVCAKISFRPEIALTRFQLAELLLSHYPDERTEALDHLDFAIVEFQEMKMAPSLEKAMRLKLETQGVAGLDVHTSIDRVQAAVQAERPDISTHAAPDGSVTIMFSDIEDSTAINERLGDQAWLDLLREHNALIREQIAAHQGFEVKTIGDAFMVAFQDPRRAVECAIQIQRAFAQPNAPVLREPQDGNIDPLSVHPELGSPEQGRRVEGRTAFENQIRVRIGLHTGEAIRDKDDFFGRNVTLAHRIADKGVGGQVLVSQQLRRLLRRSRSPSASSAQALRFDEGIEVELKGLGGKHRVFEVRWQ